jgi:hypothetical protein
MALANGQVPATLLVPAEGTAGARLRPGAAAAWARLRAAVYARHGWRPTITSLADAYRSFEIQKSTFLARYTLTVPTGGFKDGRSRTVANGGIKRWNDRYWYLKDHMAVAAVPGTSNHGWGKAVDIRDLGGFSGQRFKQLAPIARSLSFSNDEGSRIGEAWHWVFTGDLDTVTNPIGGTGTVPVVPTIPGVTPITPTEEDIVASLEQLDHLLEQKLAPIRVQLDAADAPTLYRIEGTASVWVDLTDRRRRLSAGQYAARRKPAFDDLPVDDAFWDLPTVGGDGPVETVYRQTGAEACWARVVGGRRWVDASAFAELGRPPITDLPADHPMWALPTVGPVPPKVA